MSSYTIDYSDIPDGDQKMYRAIQDCKAYLGTRRFKKLVYILQGDKGQTPKHLVRIGLSFQGIQGYPAEAMMDKFWDSQRELDFG